MKKYLLILLFIPCMAFGKSYDNTPSATQLQQFTKYIKADECVINYTAEKTSLVTCYNYTHSKGILIITKTQQAVYFDDRFEVTNHG